MSLTLSAGPASAAPPGPDPVTSILNLLSEVDAKVDTIDSTVTSIDTKENNGLMEEVITGTVTTVNTGGVPVLINLPTFSLKANKPWNLMAVYLTTQDMNGIDNIHLNYWRLGPRTFSNLLYTIDTNVTDFPVLPSDIVGGASLIAVAPNVEFYFGFSSTGTEDSFTTTFKIVIQRPTDPAFSYSLVLGGTP